MEFTPASQNGIIPPTELLSLPSRFGVLVSTTSTVYGRPVVIKAVSDAAMYKTEPVSFYTRLNGGSATLLGTSTFIDTVSAVYVATLATGTNEIYATWPGEGLYAPVSTSLDPVTVTMAAGYTLPGTMEITITPASGTRVVGEGAIDIEAFVNTAVQLTGNMLFYQGARQIGSIPIVNNIAVLQNADLRAGTNDIRIVWGGATIGGTTYQGISTSTSYTVLRGTTIPGNMTLTVSPTTATQYEGDITLTAAISTTTNLVGTVYFSIGDTPLLYAPMVDNSATIIVPNNYATGAYTMTALWDGNQSSHPRYIEKTATASFTTIERATLPAPTLTITPNPSAFKIETTFGATFNTSTSVTGNVSFIEEGVGVIGTAALVNNTAVLKTSSLTTGTKVVYAYYPGSTVEPKYFPVSSNTQTLVVNAGISIGRPINLTVKPDSVIQTTQFVVNEPIRFISTISTSTVLINNVKIFANNRYRTESPWVANVANTTTTITSTGTFDVYSYWVGGTIGGKDYEGFASSSTTITVQERATFPYNLILRSSQNPQSTGGVTTFTVTATTSTQLTGSVEFYKDSVILGTGTFAAGVASLTVPANTIGAGIYEISAQWLGSSVAPKFYAKNAANTLTQTYFVAPEAQIMTMRSLLTGSTATTSTVYWNGSPVWSQQATEIVDVIGLTPSGDLTLAPRGGDYTREVMGYPPVKVISNVRTYLYESQTQRSAANHFPGITGAVRSQSNFPLTGSISVYDITSGSNTLLVTTSTFLTTSTVTFNYPYPNETDLVYSPVPYSQTGNQVSGYATGGYVTWPTVAQWYANWSPLDQINEGVRTIKIQYNGDVYNSSTYVTYNVQFVDALNTTANYIPVDYRLSVAPTVSRSIPRIRSTEAINLTMFVPPNVTGNGPGLTNNYSVTWKKTGWVYQSGEYRLQTSVIGTSTFVYYSGTTGTNATYVSTLSNITLSADNPYTSPYYHDLDYFDLTGLDRASALVLQTEAGYTNGYNTQGTDRSLNWNTWKISGEYTYNSTGQKNTSTFWIDAYDKVPTYWAGNTSKTRLDSQSITISWNGDPDHLTMNYNSTGTAQLIGIDTLSATDRAGISLSGTVYAVYPNGSTVPGGGTVSFSSVSTSGHVTITFRPTYVVGPDGVSPSGLSNRKLVITASGSAIATTAGTTSTPVIYW
jgi:hypothetical protein